ncbi:MAG: hypothetical protein HYX73_04985 [Acidobacteria bacterium]|nr:hypothetical protein [Acidobacteriota bacterium]
MFLIIQSLMLALVLQVPASEPVQQTPSPETTTEQSQEEQSQTENQAIPLPSQEETEEASQTAAQKPSQEPSKAQSDYAQWWGTIIQAVAALLVAVFTGFLVYYNRGLLLATKLAAEAANKSANAAVFGNTYLINKERARLRFEPSSLPDFMHGTKTFSVLPRLVNYGASEALITKSGYFFSLTDSDVWLAPDLSLCQPLLPQRTVPIDGVTERRQVNFVLEDNLRDDKLGVIHFYGFVEYMDVLAFPGIPTSTIAQNLAI